MYLSLDKHVADGKLTVMDGRELEQLHFILRDFSALLQVRFRPVLKLRDNETGRNKGDTKPAT